MRTEQQARDAFEAWMLKTHKRPGTHFNQSRGVYTDNRVAAKWSAWQAALRWVEQTEPLA